MKISSSLSALFLTSISNAQLSEKGTIHADKCEVCKFMSIEMQNMLFETGKNKEKIELGRFTTTKGKEKIMEYKKSELRLIETLDETCPKILEYDMHKERAGSRRFEKGRSQTFGALQGLVDRGVKVDIGIPHDMWYEPGAEVTQMKKMCETYVELYGEDIEEWYFDEQNKDGTNSKTLQDFLCRERILKDFNQECLTEVWTGTELKDYGETDTRTPEEVQAEFDAMSEEERYEEQARMMGNMKVDEEGKGRIEL